MSELFDEAVFLSRLAAYGYRDDLCVRPAYHERRYPGPSIVEVLKLACLKLVIRDVERGEETHWFPSSDETYRALASLIHEKLVEMIEDECEGCGNTCQLRFIPTRRGVEMCAKETR